MLWVLKGVVSATFYYFNSCVVIAKLRQKRENIQWKENFKESNTIICCNIYLCAKIVFPINI